ncbi:hypothetical protein SRHO_G00221780 [Serrasalmus rhombeus]
MITEEDGNIKRGKMSESVGEQECFDPDFERREGLEHIVTQSCVRRLWGEEPVEQMGRTEESHLLGKQPGSPTAGHMEQEL